MPDIDNSFEMQIRGVAELQRALFAFNARMAERVCKIAVRQGANFMSKKIREAAPVSRKGSRIKYYGQYINFAPGRLKGAIKVKQSRLNTLSANGTIGLYVTIYPGKKWGGRVDPKGAYYGKFVENGFSRGSKAISATEALRRGMISRDELDARRATSIANQQRGRRMARSGSRLGRIQPRLSFRAGGQPVAGQHFLLNTFLGNAQQASQIIVSAAEIATRRLAQDLGFSTTL
jgi:hypothetical protein